MRSLQIAVFAFTLAPALRAICRQPPAPLHQPPPSSEFRFNSRLMGSGHGTVPILQITPANIPGP